MKNIKSKIIMLFMSAIMIFSTVSLNKAEVEAATLGGKPNVQYFVTYNGGHVNVKAVDYKYNDVLIDANINNIDATILSYDPGTYKESVKALQFMLYALSGGTNKLSYDGYYGNATVEAVKSFQRSSGLAVDGIAGPNTLNTLVYQVKTN